MDTEQSWHVVLPVQAVCGGLVWTRTFSYSADDLAALIGADPCV